MRIAILGALVALSFASGAQAQVGVCFGPQCAYPDTLGSHPNGYGPPVVLASGVTIQVRAEPDYYSPNLNTGRAPNPFHNGFNDED
jgi:hypothetical protein